jgi:hypothetical protein
MAIKDFQLVSNPAVYYLNLFNYVRSIICSFTSHSRIFHLYGDVTTASEWLHNLGWLVVYGLTSLSRFFHLYGDITIAGEGLQNLGLCSTLRAFEQGGIFIVPHLL